ncbi:ORF5a protein [Free State vervet virus]|uniref:ORF5a protein n=1 Tax=Free State vervet virus TaxID=1737586 RepID=A0A162L8T3_9NIDO|nr:ORF5a protein [Free State vervet virus]ALS54302.1 ORF5a protein [Free State vervet virus]
MFTEIGLLVDLWLYHVVCIFAILCLVYAASAVLYQCRFKRLAFQQSLRIHTSTSEDTHI